MSACYGRRRRWREKGSPPPFLSPVLSRLFPCSLFLNFMDPIISELEQAGLVCTSFAFAYSFELSFRYLIQFCVQLISAEITLFS